MTRQTFLLAAPEALLARPLTAETTRPKLLIVAAHPDDEYAFAPPLTALRGNSVGRRITW